MVLLSFDIEEFDMPLEYRKTIPFDEQIAISFEGTCRILELLDSHDIRATFFCTVAFAKKAPELIKRMITAGHEVASHGFYHSKFHANHLLSSRKALEEITGEPIVGYRMARMQPVDEREVKLAGYEYNSSLNPTWIPGRYNHLTQPRKVFRKGNVIQLPASVTPLLRFPLFWLSFHQLPVNFYTNLCLQTYRDTAFLNLYFHPWEFVDISSEHLGLPRYVRRNSGDKMIARMDQLIANFKIKQLKFSTIRDFLNIKKQE